MVEGAMVAADAVARYADEDLDRWRQLVGQDAEPADPRWGRGRVEDARWEPRRDRGPSSVRIRVRYANVGRVVFHPDGFGLHNRVVGVPALVEDVLRALAEADSDEARIAILARHSRTLRDAWDRRCLARAQARRRGLLRERDAEDGTRG